MKRDQIFSSLKDNFYTKVPALRSTPITERDSIRNLGGNSLVLSQAISQTIQQLGLRIGRDELLSLRNLGDLLDLMERASIR